LSAYATFEVYEHVNADIIEVMAFDADSDVEFNHIYLTKSEMYLIYKREVTIFEKRKAEQQARRGDRQHEHGDQKQQHGWDSSTKLVPSVEEELSEEAWLAKDVAIRDKWIGEYIMARIVSCYFFW
jgi:polyphosphate kinase 2 (PPK2 family)